MKTTIHIQRTNSIDEIQTVELDILPGVGGPIRVNDPQDGFTDAVVVSIAWDVGLSNRFSVKGRKGDCRGIWLAGGDFGFGV